MSVSLSDTCLSMVQELAAVTHFLLEARTLRRGRRVGSLLEDTFEKMHKKVNRKVKLQLMHTIHT